MKKTLTISLLLVTTGVVLSQAPSAQLPPPPPGIASVIPADVAGHAPGASFYLKPIYTRLDGPGTAPGDSAYAFPSGPPDGPPVYWSLKAWFRGLVAGPRRTLDIWGHRETDPAQADYLYLGWMTAAKIVPWVQSSFTGPRIGERCRTRINDRVDRANIIFQRGNWLVFVWTAYMRPAERGVLTWEDVALLDAVAMETDARIVSWELWGKVNTVQALAMLPGVQIEENQAKATEELSERNIWLPISPPESEPVVTPVEFLVQKLGGEWKWDEETSTGQAVIGDKTISLTAGSQEVVLNGESLHFDHAPQLAPPGLCFPLEMAKTLFQGLIDIQAPQVDATVPEQAGQAAG